MMIDFGLHDLKSIEVRRHFLLGLLKLDTSCLLVIVGNFRIYCLNAS